jgi:hypothetical protein
MRLALRDLVYVGAVFHVVRWTTTVERRATTAVGLALAPVALLLARGSAAPHAALAARILGVEGDQP